MSLAAGRPLDGGVDVPGPSVSRTGTRGIPQALRFLKGFRKASPGTPRQAHLFCTWPRLILDLCQRGVVQNVPDDHSRTQRVFASERNDQSARWRNTGASAGNHDTLQSFLFPADVSSALTMVQATTACFSSRRGRKKSSPRWQDWCGDPPITASGLSRGPCSFVNFAKQQPGSGSCWCVTK